MTDKPKLPKEVIEYMRTIGRKGGMINVAKGKEYFSTIRKGKKWKPEKKD